MYTILLVLQSLPQVEKVFVLPLHHLARHHGYTEFKGGRGMPSYRLPAFTDGPHRIWGFTAFILDMALMRLAPHKYTSAISRTLTRTVKHWFLIGLCNTDQLCFSHLAIEWHSHIYQYLVTFSIYKSIVSNWIIIDISMEVATVMCLVAPATRLSCFTTTYMQFPAVLATRRGCFCYTLNNTPYHAWVNNMTMIDTSFKVKQCIINVRYKSTLKE